MSKLQKGLAPEAMAMRNETSTGSVGAVAIVCATTKAYDGKGTLERGVTDPAITFSGPSAKVVLKREEWSVTLRRVTRP